MLRRLFWPALLALFVGCVNATGPGEDPCAEVPWREVRTADGEIVLQVKDCSGRVEVRQVKVAP